MALELVASAALSAFFQVAFQKLDSADIGDYFRTRKLDDKLLQQLKIELLSINAVVDDAELKQIKNQHVKEWLDAVKDAVIDAEDLLEDIDIEVSRFKMEAESQSNTCNCSCKVWNFFKASSSSFDKNIESKMQQVLHNLESLASKKDILELKAATSGFGVESGSQLSQKLPSTSLPVDSVIYGREVDKDVIYNYLTSETEYNISIVSIVGMGGMGKTTLAQQLYNDPKMEGKFDVKAWICVSQEFDVFKAMRAILEDINGSTDDSRDLSMVQKRLKAKLIGKRFFIVLDDIWNERRDQWEALHTPFNYGAQGSKVLVTTRSKKAASIMRSARVHELEQLQEEHCWQLFYKHAFQDENFHINSDYKEIAKKIIEKCQGLPLALKTIGSLLYTKSSLVEWECILASEIWDLTEEENNIIPALMLSYHHLSSHLKRCFAYCALFPKNYVFQKQHLILLWMAENFLQCPRSSNSMEEAGEQYFNDLLSRSFFQQSKKYKMHFIMHDLLNDLAKYVCGDFCYTFKDKESNNIFKMTRHVLFFGKSHDGSKIFEVLNNANRANRLHTFLTLLSSAPDDIELPDNIQWCHWMSSTLIDELFSKFKFLHALSLSHCFNENELPDTIGNLKHLRHLDLSFTRIRKLPESVCSLYNLQTLKLNDSWLDELPLNLHNLTYLRHLDLSGTDVTEMPMDVGKLKNLQVLTLFVVNKSSGAKIQQLGELNLHGSLSISELQNIVNPSDVLAANLKNKVHLETLLLEWNHYQIQSQFESSLEGSLSISELQNIVNPSDALASNDNLEKEREVLENLQPSKDLKELTIKSYGGKRFPDWFGDRLLNVVFLKLVNCKNCVLLAPLGTLPYLKKLEIIRLSGIVVIGSEFYGNESNSSSNIIPFASLETLMFKNMKGWKEWDCKTVTSAFPCLQELSIRNCPNLKGCLPDKLPGLMELEIFNCEQLVTSVSSVPSIHKLYISHCGKLQFDYQPSLESLDIWNCPTMNFPLGCCYNLLAYLNICSGCDSLTMFPLDFFPKLKSLRLIECRNLEMISQEHDHDNSLASLTIGKCPKFVSFPKGVFSAPSLKLFRIYDLENLKSLPDSMHTLFPSLTDLIITNCPQVESFSDGAFPSSLHNLDLKSCSKILIASLKWALGNNPSLEMLYIRNVDMESFPDEGLLPLSLTSLHISNCVNLKKLDYKGLYHLSSLEKLNLDDCPNLQCLPVEGLPKSISTLEIRDCSSLKQRCMKPNGEDWEKISHIQIVKIDRNIIN